MIRIFVKMYSVYVTGTLYDALGILSISNYLAFN